MSVDKETFLEVLGEHAAALVTVRSALADDDLSAWRAALNVLTQTLPRLEALWPPAGTDALATEGDTGDLA